MKRLLFISLFICGLCSGYFAARHPALEEILPVPLRSSPAGKSALRPTALSSQRASAASQPPLDRLRRQHVRASSDAGGSRTATWPALAALVALKEKSPPQVTTTLFNDRSELSDAFKALFDLTPAEAEQIQSSLAASRQRIETAMAQNAQVTRADETALVVTVPPFDASDLLDPTLDSLKQVLGDERYRAFLILEEKELSTALNNYGAQRRVFTITKGTNPAQPFQIDDNWRNKEGGMTVSTAFAEVQALPRKYQWLLPKLGPIEQLKPPAPPAKK